MTKLRQYAPVRLNGVLNTIPILEDIDEPEKISSVKCSDELDEYITNHILGGAISSDQFVIRWNFTSDYSSFNIGGRIVTSDNEFHIITKITIDKLFDNEREITGPVAKEKRAFLPAGNALPSSSQLSTCCYI